MKSRMQDTNTLYFDVPVRTQYDIEASMSTAYQNFARMGREDIDVLNKKNVIKFLRVAMKLLIMKNRIIKGNIASEAAKVCSPLQNQYLCHLF